MGQGSVCPVAPGMSGVDPRRCALAPTPAQGQQEADPASWLPAAPQLQNSRGRKERLAPVLSLEPWPSLISRHPSLWPLQAAILNRTGTSPEEHSESLLGHF